MPTWPNWLKHIALAVDELLQAGQWVLTRFQRMLVKAEEAEKRKSKGLSKGGRRLVEYIQNQGRSGGTGSGVLPVKALTLREKYAWLAAIHDVVCEAARPVDPYRTDKHSKRGKAVRSQSGWARPIGRYALRGAQVDGAGFYGRGPPAYRAHAGGRGAGLGKAEPRPSPSRSDDHRTATGQQDGEYIESPNVGTCERPTRSGGQRQA